MSKPTKKQPKVPSLTEQALKQAIKKIDKAEAKGEYIFIKPTVAIFNQWLNLPTVIIK